MSDQRDHLSRRNMLLGLGAAAGAGIGIAGLPASAGAASPVSPAAPFAPIRRPEALSPNIVGLVYQNIDAQAFWPTLGMAHHPPERAHGSTPTRRGVNREP